MNDKITEYESPIRIIALDLDYTTLTGMSGLSPHTEENLLRALREGIHVVVATGRGLRTIPGCMMDLEGARFYITANGAKIWDSMAGEIGPSGEPEGAFIYSNMIAPEAVEQILAFLKEKGYYFEVFIDGHGYVGRDWYDEVIAGKVPYRPVEYVRTTREPVDDIFAFVLENKDGVESVNIVYPDVETKLAKRAELDVLKGVEITTSFPRNWEIEAENVGKGTALTWLADRLGIKKEEIMACGDSDNDLQLLSAAGLPVAVGNATDTVKAVAKYISDDYDKDGVANAMDRFVFK